jgi:flagellar hook-length control protein FliK
MATLSVTVENLLGTLNAGPVAASSADGKEAFQSLLDIGLNQPQDEPDFSDEFTQAKGDRKPAKEKSQEKNNDPIAAAIDVPTTLFVTQTATQDSDATYEGTVKAETIDETLPASKPFEPKHVAGRDNQSPDAGDDAQTVQTAAAAPAATATTNVPVDASGDEIPTVTATSSTPAVSASAETDPAKPAPLVSFGQVTSHFNHLHKAMIELMQALMQQFGFDKTAPGFNPLTATDQEFTAAFKALTAGNAPAQAITAEAAPAVPAGLFDLLRSMRDLFSKLESTMGNLSPANDKQTVMEGAKTAISYLEMLKGDLKSLQSFIPAPAPSSVSAEAGDPAGQAMKYTSSLQLMLQTLQPSSNPAASDDALLPKVTAEPIVKSDIPLKPMEPQNNKPEIVPSLLKAAADPLGIEATGEAPPASDKIVSGKEALPHTASAAASTLTSPALLAASNNNAPAAIQPVAVNAADAGNNGGGAGNQSNGNGNGGSNMPTTVLPVSSASQASSASSLGAPSFARTLTQAAQQSPLLDQVKFHIKTALADGSSKISIKLDPAELGRLEIKLHVGADGKTGVVVTADNKDTLNLLQRDSRGLEQALSDAGLKADSNSLSFNLRGGQQEQGQGERNQASLHYLKNAEEEEAPELAAISRSYVINLAEGLDIKI